MWSFLPCVAYAPQDRVLQEFEACSQHDPTVLRRLIPGYDEEQMMSDVAASQSTDATRLDIGKWRLLDWKANHSPCIEPKYRNWSVRKATTTLKMLKATFCVLTTCKLMYLEVRKAVLTSLTFSFHRVDVFRRFLTTYSLAELQLIRSLHVRMVQGDSRYPHFYTPTEWESPLAEALLQRVSQIRELRIYNTPSYHPWPWMETIVAHEAHRAIRIFDNLPLVKSASVIVCTSWGGWTQPLGCYCRRFEWCGEQRRWRMLRENSTTGEYDPTGDDIEHTVQ